MLHTLRFSLQNAVYFIMLRILVPVLFIFYIHGVLKFKCKTPVPNYLQFIHKVFVVMNKTMKSLLSMNDCYMATEVQVFNRKV